MLDWSYALHGDAERRLFNRLSVFVLIGGLVDTSLLIAEHRADEHNVYRASGPAWCIDSRRPRDGLPAAVAFAQFWHTQDI